MDEETNMIGGEFMDYIKLSLVKIYAVNII